MKTVGQVQTFLGNRDQHLSANRNPDLRFHFVLGGSERRLDSQMPLDPREEQRDLPVLAVQARDQLGFGCEVVATNAIRLPLASSAKTRSSVAGQSLLGEKIDSRPV